MFCEVFDTFIRIISRNTTVPLDRTCCLMFIRNNILCSCIDEVNLCDLLDTFIGTWVVFCENSQTVMCNPVAQV